MNLNDPNDLAMLVAAVLAAAGVEKLLSLVKPRLVKAWNAMLRALTIEE
jgi:hypothetical protein